MRRLAITFIAALMLFVLGCIPVAVVRVASFFFGFWGAVAAFFFVICFVVVWFNYPETVKE